MDTLGYHIVISGYGLWLPGDERGFWSDAWDEQIGFWGPHMLHATDPVRERIARERMKRDPVRITPEMMAVVGSTLHDCADKSEWLVAALAIEPTHTHMLLTATKRDIDKTVKWLKDRFTKEIHRQTSHTGPVWCKGRWREFIEDDQHWENVVEYIQSHNVRKGEPASPYDFVQPVMP